MPRTSVATTCLVWLAVLSCRQTPSSRASGPDSVAVTFRGGTVTRAEVDREQAKLPPLMRPNFQSAFGRKDLALALVDKRLLALEARKRQLERSPEIERQVNDLQERLISQALLAEEEKNVAPPTEAEERAYYEGHKSEWATPERVHVGRVLIVAKAGSSAVAQKARAGKLRQRLVQGEALEKVAADGDGPERGQGGDMGFIARGDLRDAALEKAAFALQKPGDVSAVVEGAAGLSVLVLREHRPAVIASFEQVRGELAQKLEPVRKRRAFDQLLQRLRKEAEVHVEEPALR